MGYLEDLIKKKPSLMDEPSTKEGRKNIYNPSGIKYTGVYKELEDNLLSSREANKGNKNNTPISDPKAFYADLESSLGITKEKKNIPSVINLTQQNKKSTASLQGNLAPLNTPVKSNRNFGELWSDYSDQYNKEATNQKLKDSFIGKVGKGAGFLNYLVTSNPFTNNLLGSAAETMVGKGGLAQDSDVYKNSRTTGNKALDFTSNMVGGMLGLAAMPTDMSGNQNLLNFADDIAEMGALKLTSKLAPKLPNTARVITQGAVRGAIDGGLGEFVDANRFGKSAPEVLTDTLQGALGGSLMFGTGKAIGEGYGALRKNLELPSIKGLDYKNSTDLTPKKIATELKDYNVPKTYGVKNTALDNAYKEYDEAVQEVQNYWGNWKLDEAEIRLGAEELGIDLDGILNRMEQAEKSGVNVRDIAEQGRFSRTIGVNNNIPSLEKKVFVPKEIKSLLNPELPKVPNIPKFDNSFEGFLKRSELPERFKKNINLDPPAIAQVAATKADIPKADTGFNLDLAKGTKYEGMNVKQLNSLNARLDREYNELINAGMDARAERLVPQMKAVKEILGIEDLNEDILKWKDKSMPLYQRETFDRNLEDMIGKEDAQKYIKTYSEPLKEAEANRMRYLNDTREKVKGLGIKAGSKESELVQRYGEGELSLIKLQSETKDWKKVVAATEHLRKYYDETLNSINEVLERNGYKPVAKRADYFPHMGELEGILEKMGFKNEALPTEISGRTANFKPSKNFFANALHRTGDKTVYDAIRGFDNYAEAASKQIYLTDSIGRLRGFENEVRSIARDSNHLSNFVSYLNQYTNYIAGKKHDLDRGGEAFAGRGIYKVLNFVKKQVGSNMVGANVSSNLTNFIPITQSLATTSKPAAVKGLAETIQSLLTHNDDFVNNSDFLTRRFGSDKLAKSKWEKIGSSVSGLFEGIDRFTSNFIVRSKYHELISNGVSPKAAMKQADNYAARLMTDKSLGQLPVMFSSKTLGPFTQFQSEVNNQVSFLFKDLKGLKRSGEISNGLISAVTQISIYSWIYNNIYEKLTGRRPAIDPIEIILDTGDDKKTNFQKFEEIATSISDNLPFSSLITGGRIPLNEPVKGLYNIGKGAYDVIKGDDPNKLIEGLTTTATYIGPTGGSQLLKTAKGLSALRDSGIYKGPLNMDKSQLQYAIDPTTANKLRGVLFGASAFPESQEYYNNKRTSLTVDQTKEYEKMVSRGLTPKQAYDVLIKAREERAKKNKK